MCWVLVSWCARWLANGARSYWVRSPSSLIVCSLQLRWSLWHFFDLSMLDAQLCFHLNLYAASCNCDIAVASVWISGRLLDWMQLCYYIMSYCNWIIFFFVDSVEFPKAGYRHISGKTHQYGHKVNRKESSKGVWHFFFIDFINVLLLIFPNYVAFINQKKDC